MRAKNTVNLQNFARRLADLAEKKKLRQVDIVRALGATVPQVGNWFQGRNGPGKRAPALASLLGTDTEWLLHGRGDGDYSPTENVPSWVVSEQKARRQDDPRSNPEFDAFLSLLRGFREEAERLGGGDAASTREIFQRILQAFERTHSTPISRDDHAAALADVLTEEERKHA